MKNRFVIPIGIMIVILFACGKDENPQPTCTDGIQNGNETGIDCGGDCGECFVCTTTYCSFLSGTTTDEEKTSIDWVAIDVNWKFTFFSNGRFDEIDHGDAFHGTWEFDDPDSPTKLKATYKASLDGLILRYPIIKLVSDTLILSNPDLTAIFIKQ